MKIRVTEPTGFLDILRRVMAVIQNVLNLAQYRVKGSYYVVFNIIYICCCYNVAVLL